MLARRPNQKMNGDKLAALILFGSERFNRPVVHNTEQLISFVDAHGLQHLLPVFTKRTTIRKRQIAHEKAMVEYYRCRNPSCCSVPGMNPRL